MRTPLLVLAATLSLTAQGIDSHNPAFRRFLVSLREPAEAWVEGRKADAPLLTLDDARSSEVLGPGYHVLELPGWEPNLPYVVIVPRGAAPKEGRPVLISPSPAMEGPPDELASRAFLGAFLEEGFTLLLPVAPHRAGHRGPPAKDQRRAALGRGRELLPALIGDLAFRTPLDRDRVFLLGQWSFQATPTFPQAWPRAVVTPLAGLYLLAPGSAEIDHPSDPGPWPGRWVAFHRSRHNPDSLTVLEQRLAAMEPPVRVRSIRDRSVDYLGQLMIRRAAIRKLLADTRRPQEPAILDVLLGGEHPAGFEWLDTRRLEQPVHLRATRTQNTINVTTPDSPTGPPIKLDLWFAEVPGEITVRFNGRPIHGGTVPMNNATRLLSLRHQVQTGRPTSAVLRVRP